MTDLRDAINASFTEIMRREQRSDGFTTRQEWIYLILHHCPGPRAAAEALYWELIKDGFLANVESAFARIVVTNATDHPLNKAIEQTPELVGPGPNNPMYQRWLLHLKRIQG